VLLAAIVLVGLALAVATSGYVYLQYRWHQVRRVDLPGLRSVASGQPFNVLLVGSDSRQGETSGEARAFGSASVVGGQRSDVIKILHVDPAKGTARILDIPRDTFVVLSGMPAGSTISNPNRINAAFDAGPEPLVETIERTFGIPIAHYVEVDFNGFMGAVDAVGGVNLDFPYPARDAYSGLDITRVGCQHLNGPQALAVARSRHYEYFVDGSWHEDPTSDFGRIERQDAFLRALVKAAESHYNPLTLNAFVGSVVHDVVVDSTFSLADMVSLATRYHAFSPSDLESYVLPTYGVNGYEDYGDVLFVLEPQASELLARFLGEAPEQATTPPPVPQGTYVTVPGIYGRLGSAPPAGRSQAATIPPASSGVPTSAATSASTPAPAAFDPTPC
jgi:LCP family protein required for cell wall assembly